MSCRLPQRHAAGVAVAPDHLGVSGQMSEIGGNDPVDLGRQQFSEMLVAFVQRAGTHEVGLMADALDRGYVDHFALARPLRGVLLRGGSALSR